MAKGKAASLLGALLARKGDALASGFVHSSHDSPRLRLTAIESDAEEDQEVATIEALRAEREQRLRHDDQAVPGVSAVRGALRPRVLVPLMALVIGATGYLAVATDVDDAQPGAGGESAPAPVRGLSAPEAVLPDAATDTEVAVGPGSPAAGDTEAGSIGSATLPPATEPVAAAPRSTAAPTASVDASLLRAKIAPPLVAGLPPSRRPEEGAAGSRAANAVDLAATAAKHGYFVQLYALRSDAAVRREWQRLKERHGDLFGDLRLTVERVELESPKPPLFRLQAGLLASAAAANKLCDRARRRKLDCIVVEP